MLLEGRSSWRGVQAALLFLYCLYHELVFLVVTRIRGRNRDIQSPYNPYIIPISHIPLSPTVGSLDSLLFAKLLGFGFGVCGGTLRFKQGPVVSRE